MNKEFTVHMLNDVGKEKAISIAADFDTLLSRLRDICPPSRELALATTKLEESCFFAKKAMANDPANGVEAPGTAASVPTPPPAAPAAIPGAMVSGPDGLVPSDAPAADQPAPVADAPTSSVPGALVPGPGGLVPSGD